MFGRVSPDEAAIVIAPPSAGENTIADYAMTALALDAHPVGQIRAQLRDRHCQRSRELRALLHGSNTRAAGLVTPRQRPQTTSGATFMTLEDEDGMVSVAVWRDLAERQRRIFLTTKLLGVGSRWENIEGVHHLIAARLHDYSSLLGALKSRSRDFRWKHEGSIQLCSGH